MIRKKYSQEKLNHLQLPKGITWSLAYQTIKKSFTPIDVALWIHGIGFTEKYRKPSCKFWSSLILSVIFSVFYEAHTLYYTSVLFRWTKFSNLSRTKRNIFDFAMQFFSFFCRLWLYRRRNKLKIIIRKVAKMYFHVSPSTTLDFRVNCIAILLASDIYLVVIIILRMLAVVFEPGVANFAMFFYNNKLSPEISYYGLVAFVFGIFWQGFIPLYTIYFHFVCQVINKTLLKFKKRVLVHSMGYHTCFGMYKNLMKTIRSINEQLSTMTLMVFAYIWNFIFFHTYYLIFLSADNTYDSIRRIMQLISCLICFMSICSSSSSIEKTASEVKNAVYKLSCGQNQSKKLSLVLKTENCELFTVFDNVAINKGYFITSVGVLFSFGLAIANFDAKGTK